MPVDLAGSCRCGAVAFTIASHTPHPFMRCYCGICRKLAGGGGYAVNIMGVTETLAIRGEDRTKEIRIRVDGAPSRMRRRFCAECGSALWGWHPDWPELTHPFASAIDTDLPVPPSRFHMMLDFKAPWVEPEIRDGDESFARYPDQSIEDWHRSRSLWVA
ncbi:GFA family protein [Jannaschia ovalis]|uniref:GFA family protein n=1 Tax=Jannaschia ovalis TaxID=3038773 RepID=A0ABY8LFB7_9RHOB|nr:GFA family protein [Jannaschia sp. GRR-S6-38]WGH79972.1 GFA family protein [Jannaschia sp. GRR-S6-38]